MQNIDPLTGVATAGAAASTASMIGGYAGSTTGSRRAYSSMSGRYPGSRSWHPSPYASDNDETASEPQFYKEEKKNRIKMEIARRRQQIEENASLHDELTRLAKLRETAELSDRLNVNAYGTSPMSPAIAAAAAAAAAAGAGHHGVHNSVVTSTGTSVLKSVDEILRADGTAGGLHIPNHMTGMTGNHLTGMTSMTAGSGVTDMYGIANHTSSGYGNVDVHSHRGGVTDFSPINSDMIDRGGHFRSSSADPALNSSYMTAIAGGNVAGTGVVGAGDLYGGKYSKYGTMTGSSSLYRKY